jgi:hypothetical protein
MGKEMPTGLVHILPHATLQRQPAAAGFPCRLSRHHPTLPSLPSHEMIFLDMKLNRVRVYRFKAKLVF